MTSRPIMERRRALGSIVKRLDPLRIANGMLLTVERFIMCRLAPRCPNPSTFPGKICS